MGASHRPWLKVTARLDTGRPVLVAVPADGGYFGKVSLRSGQKSRRAYEAPTPGQSEPPLTCFAKSSAQWA